MNMQNIGVTLFAHLSSESWTSRSQALRLYCMCVNRNQEWIMYFTVMFPLKHCHGTGSSLLAKSMLDLWWTKWH